MKNEKIDNPFDRFDKGNEAKAEISGVNKAFQGIAKGIIIASVVTAASSVILSDENGNGGIYGDMFDKTENKTQLQSESDMSKANLDTINYSEPEF